MLAQPPQPGREFAVPAGDHAALAGGEQLARVEGVRGEFGARADGTAPVLGAGPAGGVLDHGDAVRPDGGPDAVQVDRHPALVDRDHRPGPPGEQRFDGGGGEVAGGPVDLREHRHRTGVGDGVGGGDEGERGDDHLVPRTDARADQRQVQRGGAGGDRDGVLDAEVLGEGPLEGGDPGALGHPAGADRLGGGLGLLLAEPGDHDGDAGHRRAPNVART